MRLSNLITVIIILTSFAVKGQDESVILRAMRDELNRNMDELKSEGYNDPFFIGYGVTELKTLSINSMNGGIFQSSTDSARSWYTRVMVGSYQVNDENYNDPKMVFTQDPGYTNLPLDDNYDGIRRSLWISTNNIYKAAARLQKSKTDLFKEIGVDSLPLRDFAKAPKVTFNKRQTIELPDQELWEKRVAQLSMSLLDFPGVFRSGVGFFYIGANHFFVNSEHTEIVTPHDLGYLNITTQHIDKDNSVFSEELAYIVTSKEDLPEEQVVKEDVETFRTFIENKSNLQTFDDLYYGPILVEGNLVSDFFLNALMAGDLSIIANRDNMNNNDKGLVQGYISDLQKEIERAPRRIANPDLNVMALTHLASYQGEKLLGNFTIDSEGVIPPDTLKLVEKGKLVTQLNGRTPVPLAKTSNGHNRLNFNFGGTYKSITPGILSITSENSKSSPDLKAELLEKAKEMGLEYALIFRPVQTTAITSMFQTVKIDVETGKETPTRIDFVDLSSNISLFRITGTSSNMIVYNQFWGQGGNGINGVPISTITPDAILIEGFEFNGMDNAQSNNKYVPTTPSPLTE